MKGPDALALLIGTKPGGKSPPGKGPTSEPSMSSGAGARAGKRLASAIQSGEGNAIYEACRAIVEMCMEGGEPDEGPAEDKAEGEPKGL